MRFRVTELLSHRPGFVRAGRGWHRQVKLQARQADKVKRGRK